MADLLEEELRGLLLDDAAVFDASGGTVEWELLPQGSGWLGLRLTRAGGARGFTHDGPDALRTPVIQLDAFGPTYLAARDLIEAAMAALVPQGSFKAFVFDEPTNSRERGDGEVETVFRARLDVRVVHHPAS